MGKGQATPQCTLASSPAVEPLCLQLDLEQNVHTGWEKKETPSRWFPSWPRQRVRGKQRIGATVSGDEKKKRTELRTFCTASRRIVSTTSNWAYASKDVGALVRRHRAVLNDEKDTVKNHGFVTLNMRTLEIVSMISVLYICILLYNLSTTQKMAGNASASTL